MMLLTATLLPPSWLAMLPQKFSAATTLSLAPPPPVPAVALDPLLSQPASPAASDTQATTANMRGRAGHALRFRARERHPSPCLCAVTCPPYQD